jgi:hypothetical protein
MTKYFCITLCWLASIVGAAEHKASLILPLPPIGQVSDEMHWFKDDELARWENQLSNLKKQENVDLKLVVLPSLMDIPADHVIREIGKKWGDSELHGVVLHIPGDNNSPYIWWGGIASEDFDQDPRVRKDMIYRMERRVRSQMSEPERVSSAVQELSDAMRVLRSQWKNLKTLREKFREENYLKWSHMRMSKRTLIAAALLIAIFSLIVLIIFLRVWKRSKQIYLFPVTSPQRRFGSRLAGGSGAAISLCKKRAKP